MGGPGVSTDHGPQKHRDTDADRPTQKDTCGTPGGRGTTPWSLQDGPHPPKPCPQAEPSGRDHHTRVCGQMGSANPVSPPSPRHSPLTWYLRSKAWFFLRRATILRSSSAPFSSCLLIGGSAPEGHCRGQGAQLLPVPQLSHPTRFLLAEERTQTQSWGHKRRRHSEGPSPHP